MSDAAARDIGDVVPLTHNEAMQLAATEYRRFVDLVDALDPEDWAARTDCPEWTVRDVAGHVLGAMRAAASLREQRRQLKIAKSHPGSVADGLSAEQVAVTAALTPQGVRRELAHLGPAAVRGRRRVPAVLRRVVTVPAQLPVSRRDERWPLGYLIDHVLTRDVWMHRSDICEATGREFVLTADHDGRLVELLVADWAGRHDRNFVLSLDGPAGGLFVRGERPVHFSSDAVEFCRSLSGRAHTVPLDAEVPF